MPGEAVVLVALIPARMASIVVHKGIIGAAVGHKGILIVNQCRCRRIYRRKRLPKDGEGAYYDCPGCYNVKQCEPQHGHVGEHSVRNTVLNCNVERDEEDSDTSEKES